MGPYLPLFSVAVEHEFFSDGLWRDLRFVPTAGSQTLMDKAGFLVRKTANGIEVYYDRSSTDAFRLLLEDAEGKLAFSFKVHADDGAFKYFSEASLFAGNALPYFDGDQGVRDGNRIRLHRGELVSEEDLKSIKSKPFTDLLGKRAQPPRPAFAVRVFICPDRNGGLEKSLQAGPVRYFLRFGSRRTYWIYYLLGSFAKKNVSIVDLDETVEFDVLGRGFLSDERRSLAFRSDDAIPLRQHSACRFQLKEAGAGNGKVLIRRLPVAAVDQMERQTIGDTVVSVSRVYVNA